MFVVGVKVEVASAFIQTFVKSQSGIRQSSLIRIDKEVILVAQPVCRQAGRFFK